MFIKTGCVAWVDLVKVILGFIKLESCSQNVGTDPLICVKVKIDDFDGL